MGFVMFTKVAPAVCVMVPTSVPVMPRMPTIILVIVITAGLCLTWEGSKYRERGGKRRRPPNPVFECVKHRSLATLELR
jgi:hypothetical protein